jgi:Fur family ferric uptake transcriptional regulator
MGGMHVVQGVKQTVKKTHDVRSYHRTQMQKENVIQKLKEKGCRITKQRLILLDIILEEDCSCCKEIYYKSIKTDDKIGTATVYRMINTLEEIGAISRKNMYKIACGEKCEVENACTVELDDDTIYHLSAKKWNAVIQAGLKVCGYMKHQEIRSVIVKQCECIE